MTKNGTIESRFKQVDVWIFDLDNTLYPPSSDLFSQVDQRMGAFISKLLNLDRIEARKVQKTYYRDYGTTLRGLMQEHGIDPEVFLNYVHDIDHSPILPNRALAEAIKMLPGQKLIFTNGSRRHAEAVAGKIGILNLFDDIFDIAASNYVPKPQHAAYQSFIDAHKINASRAAMFEDLSRNLTVPAELGMATILVTAGDDNHPDAAEDWVRPDERGDHVHHVTQDLTAFLGDISPAME